MQYEQSSSGVLLPASFAAAAPATPEMREVATTRDGRDITRGYVDPLRIQQPTDSVLRLRGNGDYTVYQEVLRDDQVASCFAQRKLAVIGKEWAVDPGGKSRQDKMAADHMLEQLNEVGFDRVTSGMLNGVYYGYAASEIMWGRDGRHITLDNIKVRDRRRFGFDGYGSLRLKTVEHPDGEALPDRKFWSFCTGADHDDEPYGLGLAHWLYWPVFFKRAGMRYWMIFLERFGQPTTMGTYPRSSTLPERQKLLDALEAINTDSGIAVPEGMEIEFLEASRSGTADYTKLYEHMDNAIAKITLGQTASTQGTPGKLGNDELQGDVRLDLIKADADLVCESFNRSVGRWLTEYNYPGAEPPRVYRKVMPEEDQAKVAERDSKIHAMGFKPTLAYIKDAYGGEWVEQTPPAAPAEPGTAPVVVPIKQPANAAFAEAQPGPSVADRVDMALQASTDNWIGRIRALVDTTNSLEQLRDELVQLLPGMTLEQYADAMGLALAAAVLQGKDDIVEEMRSGA